MLASAERVEQGVPLTAELDQALFHGSSIGGARPKALIEDRGAKYIAKFSSSSDLYSVVKAEYVAMKLASIAGLEAAPVKLVKAAGKDVLLIERFDRIALDSGWETRDTPRISIKRRPIGRLCRLNHLRTEYHVPLPVPCCSRYPC